MDGLDQRRIENAALEQARDHHVTVVASSGDTGAISDQLKSLCQPNYQDGCALAGLTDQYSPGGIGRDRPSD